MHSLRIMVRFWRPLGGIFLIYIILNLLLGNGLSAISSGISNLSQPPQETDRISQAAADFGSMLGGGWGSAETGSAFQSILFVIVSLAFIWALRQLLAGEAISPKQAYYQGMGQFIPFVLIMFLIIVQLLPMTIGAAVLSIVSTGAFGPVVTVLFTILFLLLTTWTLYMLSCSVVALYAVTLPHMEPRQALRSCKSLVHGRRWIVMRRLILMPLVLLLAAAIIFIPILIILPPLAPPLFFIISAATVFFVHTYLYALYRRLLT